MLSYAVDRKFVSLRLENKLYILRLKNVLARDVMFLVHVCDPSCDASWYMHSVHLLRVHIQLFLGRVFHACQQIVQIGGNVESRVFADFLCTYCINIQNIEFSKSNCRVVYFPFSSIHIASHILELII